LRINLCLPSAASRALMAVLVLAVLHGPILRPGDVLAQADPSQPDMIDPAETPLTWTNLLIDGSFEGPAAPAPREGLGEGPQGWHRTYYGPPSQPGPFWDRGKARTGTSSLGIVDFMPADQCTPLFNNPKTCHQWYSDRIGIDATVPHRLHFWAIADSPARVEVGLLINASTGTGWAFTSYQGTDIGAWEEKDWIIPPSVLGHYGPVTDVVLYIHGASLDSAVHSVWVDDVEFGPSTEVPASEGRTEIG
jgi:hypothetical protein